MGKKITINEIAKIANVSRGTVDRVVNKRGYVAKEKREAIEKIIDKLHFKPNIHARNLALNKKINIGIIIPLHSKGDYWEEIVISANQAAENYSSLGLNITYFYYDQEKLEDFEKFEDHFFSQNINAILATRPQNNIIDQFLKKCVTKEMPFVLINSNDTSNNAICNIGQDAFYGGRLAARLLNYKQAKGSRNIIFNIYTKNNINPNVVKRIEGFYSYIKDYKLDKESVELVEINISDPNLIETITAKISDLNGTDDGVFIPNSKSHLVANCIKKSTNFRFVGFDILPKNLKFLKNGQIDFLINQKPYEQTYQAIEILYRYLGTGVIPEKKVIIKEEIITIENF